MAHPSVATSFLQWHVERMNARQIGVLHQVARRLRGEAEGPIEESDGTWEYVVTVQRRRKVERADPPPKAPPNVSVDAFKALFGIGR